MRYSKKDIFEIIKTYLSNQHPEIKDIKPESDWYKDLKLDHNDALVFCAWVAEKFAIRLNLLRFSTLNNLAEKIHTQLPLKYRANEEQPILTEKDILKKICKYLYETYGICDVRFQSNWFKDLMLSEYQRCEFYRWIEKEFDIKLPFFYFDNIGSVCEAIITALYEKQHPTILQRIKQKFAQLVK